MNKNVHITKLKRWQVEIEVLRLSGTRQVGEILNLK